MDTKGLEKVVISSEKSYEKSIKNLYSSDDKAKDVVLLAGAVVSVSAFSAEILSTSLFYVMSFSFFFIGIIICLFTFMPSKLAVVSSISNLRKEWSKVKYTDILLGLNDSYLDAFNKNAELSKSKSFFIKLAIGFVCLGAICLAITFFDVGNGSLVTLYLNKMFLVCWR